MALKSFEHEWVLPLMAGRPGFATRRMFGGLGIHLYDRLMFVLVEPTRTGRWQWHGVLVCTSQLHHESLVASFPGVAPHDVLRKWLFLDSRHDDFEPVLEGLATAAARNDPRLGVYPSARPGKRRRIRHTKPGTGPARGDTR